jgi:hypothetical protein
MTDISGESRYKIYKLELIQGDPAIRDDLEYMRISESGYIIGILPTGEKDMRKIIRFILKKKSFYEMGDGDDLVEPGHKNVSDLIQYMQGFPKPPPGPAQSVPLVSGHAPGPLVNTLVFQTAKSASSAEYRLMPSVRKLGNVKAPAAKKRGRDKPKPSGPVIPDKYKIKPRDNSDQI